MQSWFLFPSPSGDCQAASSPDNVRLVLSKISCQRVTRDAEGGGFSRRKVGGKVVVVSDIKFISSDGHFGSIGSDAIVELFPAGSSNVTELSSKLESVVDGKIVINNHLTERWSI
jgi:hypothetical protein